MARKRVAVLISGRGSNMAALIDAAKAPDYPAEIVLVVSSRPDAAGLSVAGAAGVETVALSAKSFGERTAFERSLQLTLERAKVELICLAGFMRVLSPDFVARWRDTMINIHPSLLPAFPGLDTHARALAAKVAEHGCTVHFVRAGVDDGPIIRQTAVPVLPDDTPDTLAQRVLAAEHRLYPEVLALVAAGRVRVEGEHVVISE